MDPCPFARILVGNLSLRLLQPSPPSSRCFCKIRLTGFPTQDSPIQLITTTAATAAAPPATTNNNPSPSSSAVAASFDLNKSQIEKLMIAHKVKSPPSIEISIHQERTGWGCGGGSKFIGKVSVPIPTPIPELMEYLRRGEPRGVVIHNGWVKLLAAAAGAEVFVTVRAEADPRFVFEFEKEPECSPQVFQLQGNVKQPVFTCKFAFRTNNTDRNLTSRSSMSETSTSRTWLSSLASGDKQDKQTKERKGWSVTIHDLSGSPVAAASMVTPFVPSPGTDRVSRSNPGAWLILRPGHGTWNPWGRLEAWREKSGSDAVSYRFELLSDSAGATDIATSNLSIKSGGRFVIDTTSSLSPVASPSSSMDFGSWSWSGSGGSGSDLGSGASPHQFVNGGFVMSSTMQGVGCASKARVEVGVHHVACAEDAAVFVALAAAMDLSMDACKLFSRKLRKELRQPSQEAMI